MIIGIDMGHCLSGEGTGAKGCGHKEEVETRNIGKIVIDMLKQEGNTVIDCTVDRVRNNSAQLNERVSKANKQKLDLFISIHFNACINDEKGNGKTTGTEAFVYSSNSKAKPYAERIVNNLSDLGLKNRGIKLSKEAAKGGIAVVDKTTSPALLIECCFIDDRDDMNLYNPSKFAKAIVAGILNKSIIEKYAYGIKVYDFATKESAVEFSNKMISTESAYNYVEKNNSKWCVKIESFSNKKSALNFGNKLKQKYNAYNEIYTV